MSTHRHNTWRNTPEHDLDVARFVIEDDDAVDRVVSRAVAVLRRLTRGKISTFAQAVAIGTPESLTVAAEAIYVYLSENYHLSFDKELRFDQVTGEQRIRLPDETLENSRGACIDLVVLYLSCLANAGLCPIYIQLCGENRDHCLAGALLYTPPEEQERSPRLSLEDLNALLAHGRLLVVECTGFVEAYPPQSSRDKIAFSDASRTGRKLLEAIATRDFGFALDIRSAWRFVSPHRAGDARASAARREALSSSRWLRRSGVALAIGVVAFFLLVRAERPPTFSGSAGSGDSVSATSQRPGEIELREPDVAATYDDPRIHEASLPAKTSPLRPSVLITRVPPWGKGGDYPRYPIGGTVQNVNPAECDVIVYTRVHGESGDVWWVQPRDDRSFTTLEPDNSWVAYDVGLGEEYAALLVKRGGYTPPVRTRELPEVGGAVLAVTRALARREQHRRRGRPRA